MNFVYTMKVPSLASACLASNLWPDVCAAGGMHGTVSIGNAAIFAHHAAKVRRCHHDASWHAVQLDVQQQQLPVTHNV